MTTSIELILTASPTGIAQVHAAADALKRVLDNPHPSPAKTSDELAALAAKAKNAELEVGALWKQIVDLTAANKSFSQSMSGAKASLVALAASSATLSKDLQEQALALGRVRQKVSELGEADRALSLTNQAQTGVISLQNTEFQKQASILTQIQAKTDAALVSERSRTQELIRAAVAQGDLTAAEAVALGVTDRLIVAEAEHQRLLATGGAARAAYAAATLEGESAAQRMIGVKQAEIGFSKQLQAQLELESARRAASNVVTLEGEAAAQRMIGAKLAGSGFSEQLRSGMSPISPAYANLTREQAVAIEMNRLLDAQNKTAIINEARRALGLKALRDSSKEAALGLHSLERGAAGAAGKLWLTYGAMVPLLGSFIAVSTAMKGIKFEAEFEDITNYTAAISEAAGGVDRLRESLLAIKDVPDSATVLAGATKELVKAGFEQEAAVSNMATLSKAAAVAQEDLGLVTKVTAAQYRAWSDDIVGSERGMESLAQTTNVMSFVAVKTATDYSKLAEGLKHTLSLAGLSNIKFTELVATLGAMSNIGLEASMAGTGLRNAMVKLQNPTEKVKKELEGIAKATGMQPFSAWTKEGKAKGVAEFFSDLSDALAPLTDEKRMQVLNDLLGLRGLGVGEAALRDFARGVGEGKLGLKVLAAGAEEAGRKMTFVDEKFAEVSQSTKEQWRLLSAEVHNAMIKAFDGEAVNSFVKTLRGAVADGTLQSILEGLAKISDILITVTGWAVKLSGTIGTIAASWAAWGLGGWLTAAAGGVVAFAGGIASLGTAWLATVALFEVGFARISAAAARNPVGLALVTGVLAHQGIKAFIDRFKGSSEEEFAAAIRGTKSSTPAVTSTAKVFKPDTTKGTGTVSPPSSTGAGRYVAAYVSDAELQSTKRNAEAVLSTVKTMRAKLEADNRNYRISQEDYYDAIDALKIREMEANIAVLRAEEEQRVKRQAAADADFAKHADKQKARERADQAEIARKNAANKIAIAVRERDAELAAQEQAEQDRSRLVYQALEDRVYAERRKASAEKLIDFKNNAAAEENLLKAARSKFLITEDEYNAAVREARLSGYDEQEKDLLVALEGQKRLLARARAKWVAAPGTEAQTTMLTASQAVQDTETALRRVGEAKQDQIELDKELSVSTSDWAEGVSQGFRKYADDASNAFEFTRAATERAFKGMEDALLDFVTTGKLNFTSLIDSMIVDLTRLALRQSLVGGGEGGGMSGLLGIAASAAANYFFGGPTASGYGGISNDLSDVAGGASLTGNAFAAGGWINEPVVGKGLWSGSPYSFAENEPELVSNQRQARADSAASNTNIEVRVINQTQREVKATTGEARFDGRTWIVSTILEDVEQGGPLRGLFSRTL